MFILQSFPFVACILCTCILQHCTSYAQSSEAPTAVWLLPGVTYQQSEKLKFTCQYGFNTYLSVNAWYPQAFIKVGRMVTLNPAYLYLNFPDINGPGIQEHTFMNAVTFTFPLKKFLVDDRSLLWNRFRQNAEDIHFFRNRLRIMFSFEIASRRFRVFSYDEAWLYINEHRWTRNRLAFGFTCDIVNWLNLDISYVREHDKYNGATNLLFILGTFQLEHKKKK